MYPGHFAAGLALKVSEPRASTLGIMIGVGFLDLIFAVGVWFRCGRWNTAAPDYPVVALAAYGGGVVHLLRPRILARWGPRSSCDGRGGFLPLAA